MTNGLFNDLIEEAKRLRLPHIVMMFHSSELMLVLQDTGQMKIPLRFYFINWKDFLILSMINKLNLQH